MDRGRFRKRLSASAKGIWAMNAENKKASIEIGADIWDSIKGKTVQQGQLVRSASSTR